jgi:hypothetical protein
MVTVMLVQEFSVWYLQYVHRCEPIFGLTFAPHFNIWFGISSSMIYLILNEGRLMLRPFTVLERKGFNRVSQILKYFRFIKAAKTLYLYHNSKISSFIVEK